MKAGVDRIVISPPEGMYLIGFADRVGGTEGIRDDLTATTLVLDDGREKFVIVALDLLLLNWEIVDRIRGGIADNLGIPTRNILLCCSHTHSGPVGWAPSRITFAERIREVKNRVLALPATLDALKTECRDGAKAKGIFRKLLGPRGIVFNKKYMDNLVASLVDSVTAASKRMVDAAMRQGRGTVRVGINRRERAEDGTIVLGRHEDGPVDPDVEVIQIRSDDGPVATLVNHACHLTVLGPNSNVVSADMIGFMRAKVEGDIGGFCMFLQGATGDINPDSEWSDDNDPDVERLGEALADTVLKIERQLTQCAADPMRAVEDTVDAYLDVPAGMERWPVRRIYRHMINENMGIPRFLIDPLLYIRYPWKTKIERKPAGYATPVRLGALRIGDVAIGWLSMETFVEIGRAVKGTSSIPVTLFAGYTNGYDGYLPTVEEKKLGGYEVEWVPYLLRLPGTFRADTDARVTERLSALLEEVAR